MFHYKNTAEIFPWLLTYTSNIYQSINNIYVGDFNHFWSLAVEEQFYLFWPFIILFIKPNRTLLAIFLTIFISLLTRGYLFLYVGKWMATAYFTMSCMHALGLGALLAYIKTYKPKTEKKIIASSLVVFSKHHLYCFVNHPGQIKHGMVPRNIR